MKPWGSDPHVGIGALKRADTRDLTVFLPTQAQKKGQGESQEEGGPSTSQKEGSHQALNWLAPWSQASLLLELSENKYGLFEPPGLRYFVMVALAHEDTQVSVSKHYLHLPSNLRVIISLLALFSFAYFKTWYKWNYTFMYFLWLAFYPQCHLGKIYLFEHRFAVLLFSCCMVFSSTDISLYTLPFYVIGIW